MLSENGETPCQEMKQATLSALVVTKDITSVQKSFKYVNTISGAPSAGFELGTVEMVDTKRMIA